MNKFIKLFAILFAVSLIAGCSHSVHMDITDSNEMKLKITTAKTIDEEALKEKGYKVTVTPAEDETSVPTSEITKTYKLDKISSKKEVEIDLAQVGTPDFDDSTYFQVVKSSLVSSTYKANFIFDATADMEAASATSITYTVTLPRKAISHNADSVDGTTYTWNVTADEVKEIEFEFKTTNMTIIYVIVGVVVVGGIGIFMVMRKKKMPANPMIQGGAMAGAMPMSQPTGVSQDMNVQPMGTTEQPMMAQEPVQQMPDLNQQSMPQEQPYDSNNQNMQ